MQDYYDEQEIDLLDLLYKVLIHIKKELIIAIVFGILFSTFAVYKNYREDKIAKAIIENKELALDKYKNDISLQEVFDVDVYITDVLNQEKKIDYLENSLKYNLEDNKTNNLLEANFIIQDTTDTTGVIKYINSIVIDDELINNYLTKLNINTNSKYYTDEFFLRELITVEDKNTNVPNFGAKSSVISLTVLTSLEETSLELGNLIVERILDNKEEINNKFNTNISLITKNLSYMKFAEIDNEKKEIQEDITTLSSTIEKVGKNFNNIQLRYLAYRNNEEFSVLSTIKSIIKYFVIGILVGGFVSCAYYGMIYILNGKLHTKDDLKYLHINDLGVINLNIDNNKCFKNIFKRNQVSKDKGIELAIEKIKAIQKNKGIKQLSLATTLNEEKISGILTEIQDTLKIKNVYYSVNTNSNFISTNNGKGIILIEVLEESKVSDLNNLYSLTKDCGLNIIGSVLIDNE